MPHARDDQRDNSAANQQQSEQEHHNRAKAKGHFLVRLIRRHSDDLI